MTENNLTQLVGALGGWLEARPYGATQDALDRAARIVLDMRLLGVGIDEVDAPELAALDPKDRDVVEEARVWAQARREEARRRRVAEERIARQRRVAERESGPDKLFAPAPSDRARSLNPSEPTPPRGGGYPRSVSGSSPSAASPDAEAASIELGDGVVADLARDDDDGEDLFFFAEPQPDPKHESASHTSSPTKPKPTFERSDGRRRARADASLTKAGLSDPDEHAFFTVEELRANTDQDSSWFRPDVVFKVVIVVWGIAAVGVVLVLLGMAFG